MAAAKTEALVELMINHTCTYSSVEQCFNMLQMNIDAPDGMILHAEQRDETTAAVYGSEEQIALMRRIWDVVQANPWDRATVLLTDEAVEAVQNATSGPLFFRLILMIYTHWSRKWQQEQDESGSQASDQDSDDDDDDADEMEDVQDDAPGPAQVLPLSRGAHVRALLAVLNVY